MRTNLDGLDSKGRMFHKVESLIRPNLRKAECLKGRNIQTDEFSKGRKPEKIELL